MINKKRRILFPFLLFTILAGIAGFFALRTLPLFTEEKPTAVEQNIPPETCPSGEPAPAVPEQQYITRGTVSKGDTLSEVLASCGTEGPTQHFVSAVRSVFPVRLFQAGKNYTVVRDPDTGRLSRFEYEIDDDNRLVVEGLEDPVARVEKIEYICTLSLVKCTIDDNMFQAVADAGELPQLALSVADIFRSEINFISDLKKGDSFSVLVEKRYRDGEYRGYGRVLGSVFINNGKRFEGFLFTDENGRKKYFDARGENLTKVLMQVPLSFTRISSGFGRRIHPVLGVSKEHPGIDYAAPIGTPVKAAGDGIVTFKGWKGGYGNHVIIRHDAGLETLYSHMSGYARGLLKGTRVKQGQVIAYVGSTGMSTGPHLDFRVRQNGKFINPAKAVNPRAKAVGERRRRAFEHNVELVRSYLDGRHDLTDYRPDMVHIPE